ncbi:autophagy-related protein 27 [Apiospora saccharicola]|uniref:Autophagy-related protein 27 n=1 Tax=Apiospora saccharicola TaxID=335842 RepID=A0ABR1W147_9PEZI
MRFSSSISPGAADASLILLLLAPAANAMLQCESIVADGKKFNMKPLGGAHSVIVSQLDSLGTNFINTTYTTDICQSLKRKGDVDRKLQCPQGTRVCALEHYVGNDDKRADSLHSVFPIAGELKGKNGGGNLDHEAVRLSTSDSNSDSKKEGLRLVLRGGIRSFEDGTQKKQQAIIEFVCDKDKEGTEGEIKPSDEYDDTTNAAALMRRGSPNDPLLFAADEGGDGKDGKDGDKEPRPTGPVQLGPEDRALIFESYGALESDKNIDVLRLTWKTKHACENAADNGDETPSKSWGFFTWIVILVFLGTASYLIFGSWLNYNRYGARGWDLLPHGDTIRDIPYLMKDWVRRVLNTVQGSGASRGGYSAV